MSSAVAECLAIGSGATASRQQVIIAGDSLCSQCPRWFPPGDLQSASGGWGEYRLKEAQKPAVARAGERTHRKSDPYPKR